MGWYKVLFCCLYTSVEDMEKMCSGLNHVNYLNIIKRDYVSATVRTRLHLASGWSLDHSGA